VGLLGRDLLFKLRTQITFDSDGTVSLKLKGLEAKTLILTLHKKRNGGSMSLKGGLMRFLSFSSRFQVYGLAQNVLPVVVELKLGATPVSQKQYFIPWKAQVGIQRHFERLLKYGILSLFCHPGAPSYYQSRNQGMRISGQFRTSRQ
jgi:hypothetical protein